MKTIIKLLLLALCLLPSTLQAQGDLRVIYIRQDNSTNVQDLTQKLKKYFAKYPNDEILLYYSDTKPLIMDRSSFSETILVGTISSKNSYIPVNTTTELDVFSTKFEQKTPKGFNNLTIDFFVSEDFFSSGDQDNFVARFLIVNSLENYKKLTLNYYPCGGKIDENDLMFDKKYGLTVKTNLVL